MIPVNTTTDQVIQMAQDRHVGYLREKHELMEGVLAARHLSDIDRAVYGLLGSEERLGHYRNLAAQIGEHTGKPLVIINKTEDIYEAEQGRRLQAVTSCRGGIISGPLGVEFGGPQTYGDKPDVDDEEAKEKIDRATIYVPVRPEVSREVYKRMGRAGVKTHLYINGNDDAKVDHTALGAERKIRIAMISKSYGVVDDFGNQPAMVEHTSGRLLVGRANIYSNPLFARGVHQLLERIEEIS